MRRRKDDMHGSEPRDLELGRALEELDSPEYPPDFLAGVWARVDAGEGEAPGASDGAVPARPPRRARGTWFRRPAFVATATVGPSQSSPWPSSWACRASPGCPAPSRSPLRRSSRRRCGRCPPAARWSWQSQRGTSRRGAGDYRTTHIRLVMRSDGSYRGVQTDVAPVSAAKGRPRKGYEGGVYDAPTGVFRHYVTGWEEDAGRYMREAEVITGWPLGPPDAWVSLESGVQSVALALRSAGRATVTTTSFAGRPVWVISATGVMALRDKTERQTITIDRKTCLPLRVQAWKDDVLQVEYTWRYLGSDAPIAESTFTRIPTRHMKTAHSDAGFRRWPLAKIAATPGYVVLLPTRSPAGYRLKWVAAAERSTTANEITEGRDVTALQYVRGFDGLTVTTRTVSDPVQADRYDPVDWETSYAHLVTRDVTLADGAFSGATAHVVVAPGIMVPHLYAVKGNVMLTVVGAATAKELVAVAESLRPYPSATASPSASAAGQ